MMTDDEKEKTAREIDEIREAVAPLLRGRTNLASAMALTMMAAHHVMHDGGDEDGFASIARLSWDRSQELHETCGIPVRCWLMNRPESEKIVFVDDEDAFFHAADDYVGQNVKYEPGGICFVWTEYPTAKDPDYSGRKILWQVEAKSGPLPLILFTVQTTEEEARALLRKLSE